MEKALERMLVELPPPVTDTRGAIQPLAEAEFRSALVITSRAGAIRANHYHKTDYHYCWIQSGRMVYYERPVGSTAEPLAVTVTAGEVVYTAPMVEHAMRFLEDSVMLCFARNSRHMADYEADTVRVDLIA